MDWDPKQIPDRDLLETVRPERDGDDDPLVKELRQRLQSRPELVGELFELRNLDRELAQALQNVPVPPGLEERILRQLGHLPSASEQFDAVGMPRAERPSVGSSNPTMSREAVSAAVATRRRWLAAMLSGACAVGLGSVAVWLWRNRVKPSPPTALKVATEIAQVFEQTLGQFGTGRSVSTEPPPAGYRMSHEIRLYPGATVTWRSVPLRGLTAVVFDIAQPGGEQGSLFVLAEVIEGLPPFPPYRPALQTSRSSLGWWRENENAFVLAVLGGPRIYQRFLKPPRPLT